MVSRNEMRGGQGWLIRHLGGFPVNTDHPGRRTIRCSLKLLKGQKMIVVFPEGDIYQDGQLHSLKPGLAYLALQTARTHNLNVQVVPIAIQYSQATPTWRCSVKMKIAPTLNTRSYGNLAFKQGTEQLTADLANVLGTLVQELSS
jgi:1-acyl-sn-glycerol-3-phosphate acyltransferase